MIKTERDLSWLNELKTDEKVQIVNAVNLIEEVAKAMKESGNDVSLPYRLQLRSDIGETERLVRKFRPGKDNSKHLNKLQFLMVKLKTEADNIFK